MHNDTDRFAETQGSDRGVSGHRARVKEKFSRSGANGMADYELLELVLFRSIPRRDTKPIAKELISVFGTFAEALNAAPERLKEVSGVGEGTVSDFQVIKAAAAALLKGDVR